ncbi:MAG: hypothetical protein MHM6MM_004674 [Cercozoa sp. M6MM]
MRFLATLVALSVRLALGAGRSDSAPQVMPQSEQSLHAELANAVDQTEVPWPTSYVPSETPAAPGSSLEQCLLSFKQGSEVPKLLVAVVPDAQQQLGVVSNFCGASHVARDFETTSGRLEYTILPIDTTAVGFGLEAALPLIWLAAVYSNCEREKSKVKVARTALAQEQQTSELMEMLEAATFLGATNELRELVLSMVVEHASFSWDNTWRVFNAVLPPLPGEIGRPFFNIRNTLSSVLPSSYDCRGIDDATKKRVSIINGQFQVAENSMLFDAVGYRRIDLSKGTLKAVSLFDANQPASAPQPAISAGAVSKITVAEEQPKVQYKDQGLWRRLIEHQVPIQKIEIRGAPINSALTELLKDSEWNPQKLLLNRRLLRQPQQRD